MCELKQPYLIVRSPDLPQCTWMQGPWRTEHSPSLRCLAQMQQTPWPSWWERPWKPQTSCWLPSPWETLTHSAELHLSSWCRSQSVIKFPFSNRTTCSSQCYWTLIWQRHCYCLHDVVFLEDFWDSWSGVEGSSFEVICRVIVMVNFVMIRHEGSVLYVMTDMLMTSTVSNSQAWSKYEQDTLVIEKSFEFISLKHIDLKTVSPVQDIEAPCSNLHRGKSWSRKLTKLPTSSSTRHTTTTWPNKTYVRAANKNAMNPWPWSRALHANWHMNVISVRQHLVCSFWAANNRPKQSILRRNAHQNLPLRCKNGFVNKFSYARPNAPVFMDSKPCYEHCAPFVLKHSLSFKYTACDNSKPQWTKGSKTATELGGSCDITKEGAPKNCFVVRSPRRQCKYSVWRVFGVGTSC